MPIYEYECKRCHSRFEQLESISQEPLKVCPTCGGEAQRLISRTGAILVKGYPSSSGNLESESTRCGNLTPCCGKETRCEERPCD